MNSYETPYGVSVAVDSPSTTSLHVQVVGSTVYLDVQGHEATDAEPDSGDTIVSLILTAEQADALRNALSVAHARSTSGDAA